MEGSVSPFLDSLAWTRDGSAVLFEGGGVTWSSGIWRITITGDHAPERIAAAGEAALTPAVAASRDRLAFSRAEFDADIYRFEAGRPVQLVTGSTFSEADPRLSPDGHRLAFASARSGGQNEDVWVADVDGSNPQQLTKGPGLNQGSPDWSPDGRRIVFDSRADDRTTLWTIDANGGAPHRLTTAAGDQVRPTWSHDGQWIYFSGGRRDIFRVPAGGGDAKRLTNGAAGPFACESADGKNLLYQTKDADAPLMMMPLTGGQSRQLVACVKSSAFGAGPRGVYYVSCDPSPDPPLHVLDPKTGRDERLGTLDGMRDRPLGLSVSADGRTIVYARAVLSRADLMLIENFR